MARSNGARALLVGVVLLAGGCATTLPEAIDRPVQPVGLLQAQQEAGAWVGRTVRWGGTIAKVENRAEETWVEVVARRLDSGARPVVEDRSDGRFLARVSGFLDPAIYAPGRLFTVVGTLERPVTRTIGDYPYRFPVVRVDGYQLWEPLPEPRAYPYPYGWYDPWYPWRRPWLHDPYWW